MSTETEHAAALRTVLTTSLGTTAQDPSRGVFDYDDAPETLPKIYGLITVTKRSGAPIYMVGGKPSEGWRLTTLAVGRSVDEARYARDRMAAAIEDQRVTIAGRSTSRIRLESESPIEPDDGRYSGLTTWTYAR